MNITPSERDKAINEILDKGLVEPVSTPMFLRNMFQNLGTVVIFRGALPGVFLSLFVASAYVLMVVMYIDNVFADLKYNSLLFLFSPMLFIGLTLSTEATELIEGRGLYELKMACRYTVRQITAFRLLCFSLVGTIFAVIVGYSYHTVIETGYLLHFVSLALSSLFLCTLLIIFTMRHFRVGWWFGSCIWTAFGLLPMAINRHGWEELLSHLPPVLTLGVAVVAFTLFLREIKIMTREVRYADC
ncbi:MAG: hypothetical protein FWF81_12145 [Defluviitaleaceae bacterium]|nr:hypothetical protein [Defluviitaleaceae bacterium]